MHWTELLAYRRFPENAFIADDLDCLGCGYNLRSLQVRGVCPECGRSVEESLVLLTQPARVAAALATIGKSYLGLLGLSLMLVAAWIGAQMLLWLMFIILACCVLLRCIGALELRFLSGLQHRPQVTSRITVLWWAIVLELVATLALLSLWAFNAVNGIELASAVWAVATLFSIVAAGQSGIGLARLLEYDSIVRELRIQQILVVVALGLGGLTAVSRVAFVAMPAGNSTGMQELIALMVLATAVAGIAAVFITFTGLLRLSIAAHSETEPMDHLVSTDASMVTRPPPAPRPSQPRDESDVPLA